MRSEESAVMQKMLLTRIDEGISDCCNAEEEYVAVVRQVKFEAKREKYLKKRSVEKRDTNGS